MGPYCNYCGRRCFVPFPEGTPQEALDAYRAGVGYGVDIITTCAEGQAHELIVTDGWCYDRIKLVISKPDYPHRTCDDCDGTGKRPYGSYYGYPLMCLRCDGTGRVPVREEVAHV